MSKIIHPSSETEKKLVSITIEGSKDTTAIVSRMLEYVFKGAGFEASILKDENDVFPALYDLVQEIAPKSIVLIERRQRREYTALPKATWIANDADHADNELHEPIIYYGVPPVPEDSMDHPPSSSPIGAVLSNTNTPHLSMSNYLAFVDSNTSNTEPSPYIPTSISSSNDDDEPYDESLNPLL